MAASADRVVAVGDGGVILVSKSGDEVPFGYDRWISDQGATDSETATERDINLDGVPNLIAYLHGLPALSPLLAGEREILPTIRSSAGGLEFTFEIFNDRTDVEIWVQRTLDLTTWTDVAHKRGTGSWGGTANVLESSASNGRKRVSVVDDSLPETSAAYYRIWVKRL